MEVRALLTGLALLGIGAFAMRWPRRQSPVRPADDLVETTSVSRIYKTGSRIALFLDIDGVLHRKASGSLEYLPAFEAVMRERPEVDLVISSSWRETMRADALLAVFSSDIQDRIIGMTPVLSGQSREAEIRTFAHAAGLHRWIAIDDRDDEFSPDCPRLFKTETSTALDQATAAALAARLKTLTSGEE